MTRDIAVAHWSEAYDGGGERVGWELARALDEPLWVGSRDPTSERDDIAVRELWPDGLARRLIDRGGLSQMAGYAYLWQTHADPLGEADIVVTSGNEPLFYVPDGEQTWVAYVHHTGRQATDLVRERYDDGPVGAIARLVRFGQRIVMDAQATKPDVIVANSEPVARRITRYWGVPRDRIRVVYPPVAVDAYSADGAPTEDFYLSLCRLDWHKRVGEIVEAFRGRDETLYVAGDGDARDDLEADAPANVEFLGYVSEARKRRLFSRATAAITNARAEDFGITTVEPMAAGTPVLGVREGMTQHLVRDGETGYTYARGDLEGAVDRFEREGVAWDDGRIERFADRFSTARFHDRIRQVVAEADRQATAAHRPPWVDRDTEEPEPRVGALADGG